jgi:hypothetical protein
MIYELPGYIEKPDGTLIIILLRRLSFTPDGHDYRGMSSGHTDVLSKITYYILLHGWGIK